MRFQAGYGVVQNSWMISQGDRAAGSVGHLEDVALMITELLGEALVLLLCLHQFTHFFYRIVIEIDKSSLIAKQRSAVIRIHPALWTPNSHGDISFAVHSRLFD
jgi:hypothetical protein